MKIIPKYKVGQIVVMASTRRELTFRILSIKWDDGYYYQWNKNNYASEEMLRGLTDEEKGD